MDAPREQRRVGKHGTWSCGQSPVRTGARLRAHGSTHRLGKHTLRLIEVLLARHAEHHGVEIRVAPAGVAVVLVLHEFR